MVLTRVLLSQLLTILLVPAFTALLHITVSFLQLLATAHFAWLRDSPFADDDNNNNSNNIFSGTRNCNGGDHAEEAEEIECEAEEIECVFCLCDIKEGEGIRELRCKHLFHRSCLDRWLEFRHATCPLCRDTLSPWRTRAKSAAEADDGGLLGELELEWIHVLSGGSF